MQVLESNVTGHTFRSSLYYHMDGDNSAVRDIRNVNSNEFLSPSNFVLKMLLKLTFYSRTDHSA